MKFTLYPIYCLALGWDDEPFDLNRLPFDLIENVRIEAVAERFREGTFDLWRERLGESLVAQLNSVRYALVHRYNPENDSIVSTHNHRVQSEALLRNLAACLRLVRPMRQLALLMHGNIRDEDGSFDVSGFDVPPPHSLEVPEVQKLFKLRNQDADDLRAYAPEFLRGMRGDFWKFQMAVQFHELGHFQPMDWKARYLLWCSAIESIYTSHDWEHQGSLVATSRIKWFLGEYTSIYPPGDIPNFPVDPHFTIGRVIGDLYEMRNYIAHGDKIPDSFFTEILRRGFDREVNKLAVLLEAASFVIRASLLKILRDGLLDHFADAGPAEAYFGAFNLTRSRLRAAQRAGPATP